MPDDQIYKPEDVVKETFGQKVFGHDKDLENLKEKITKCYTRGDKDFVQDVEGIVSETIQKDENRNRIQKYAKEVAQDVLRESSEKSKEDKWKSKGIWIPAIIAIVAAILGSFLGPFFQGFLRNDTPKDNMQNISTKNEPGNQQNPTE